MMATVRACEALCCCRRQATGKGASAGLVWQVWKAQLHRSQAIICHDNRQTPFSMTRDGPHSP
jgi:hypothetical protein